MLLQRCTAYQYDDFQRCDTHDDTVVTRVALDVPSDLHVDASSADGARVAEEHLTIR